MNESVTQSRYRQISGKSETRPLESATQRLEEAFDQEMLKEASNVIRLRIEPRTWEAFELLAIEGYSGAEAAARLQMKVATVFVARSKVQRMLREELARLELSP